MNIVILALLAAAINSIVGAIVWAHLDYEDQRLYDWYAKCPKSIAWFACPLVLMCWPVGVWLRLTGRI
jgi:hypothetical protein